MQLQQPQPQQGDALVGSQGGEARWICNGPEAEIARLRDSLAHVEERRRLEAVLFEDRARRVEAELEQCRAEGLVFSRLCEERDSLVGCLRAELSEAQAERSTFQRELAEARQELERRRPALLSSTAAMRQVSGTLPATAGDRAGGLVVVASGTERSAAEPHASLTRQLSPNSAPSTALAAATSGASAMGAMDTSSGGRAVGGGPTSARAANRLRAGSSDQVAAPPTGASLHVAAAAANAGGGGHGPLGRPSSLPPSGHGGSGRAGPGTLGLSAVAPGGTDSNTADEGPNSGRPVVRPSPMKTGANVTGPNGFGSIVEKPASEKPVEITISVPRALTPDEVMELAQQTHDEPPAAPPPSAQPVPRSLWSQSPSSQSPQPWAGNWQALTVNRQASAPTASSAMPASPLAADQWPADARWFGAGAAPPPPVRVVSASQQVAAPKPGSATIPTASGMAPSGVAMVAAGATVHGSSGVDRVVLTATSQARLGVSYRR